MKRNHDSLNNLLFISFNKLLCFRQCARCWLQLYLSLLRCNRSSECLKYRIGQVLTYAHTHETIATIKIKNILITPESLLKPLGNPLLLPLSSASPRYQATTDAPSVPVEYFPFPRTFYKWYSAVHILSLSGFFSLSIIILRLVPVIVCISNTFLFYDWAVSTVRLYHNFLSIQMLMDIWVGRTFGFIYIKLWWPCTSFCMSKSFLHALVWRISLLLGTYLGVDQVVTVCFTFWEAAKSSSKAVIHFTISAAADESSGSSTSSSALHLFSLLNVSHSRGI